MVPDFRTKVQEAKWLLVDCCLLTSHRLHDAVLGIVFGRWEQLLEIATPGWLLRCLLSPTRPRSSTAWFASDGRHLEFRQSLVSEMVSGLLLLLVGRLFSEVWFECVILVPQLGRVCSRRRKFVVRLDAESGLVMTVNR
jgi:hypothetical protein